LAHVLDLVDLVLIMSVNPGFGGQKFIPGTLRKVTQVKEMLTAAGLANRVEIQVDGGVDLRTAPLCIAAGATCLVAGTAIFGQVDYGQAVSGLRQGVIGNS
jgi:ribulose-phosphate 3-epimerase